MMRAVQLSKFGGREVLSIASVPRPVLRPREVLVKVGATAVNRADISQRKGFYPPPPGAPDILGLEFAGTVVERPDASNLPVGARVMGILSGGGYAEYVAVPEDHCVPIPDDLSITEAAGLTETFLTAFQAIHHHAALHPDPDAAAKYSAGQKARPPPEILGRPYRMIMHGGGSGVGLAACQVAKLFGIEVITTSSEGKVEECRKFATHAVSRTPSEAGHIFKDKIEALLGPGEGVDLIIDPVFGGKYTEENAAVLAKDGTVVVLSFLGGSKLDKFDGTPYFLKRANIKFSTLRSQSNEYKAGLTQEFIKLVMPAVRDGRLRPVISKVLPLEEIAEAHRVIEENEIAGKCVVVVDPTVV